MNASPPPVSLKRLKAAGFDRRQAEAIAGKINHGTDYFVTKHRFGAALDETAIRIGILVSGIVAIAVLGMFISLK